MLPDRIPAASAISRTVVARKPFWANSSLAILTMSARRCDRTAPFAAGTVARFGGWLFRVGSIAPLWLASGQPPKRLLAYADRPRLAARLRSCSPPDRAARSVTRHVAASSEYGTKSEVACAIAPEAAAPMP